MQYIYQIPAAFFALIIHEWVKARTSSALGDTTPYNNGFITWNPLKFFEPIGFFLMLIFQVGWARPVQTSPLYYSDRRKGVIITYTTPIVVNLLLGLLALFILRVIPYGIEAHRFSVMHYIAIAGGGVQLLSAPWGLHLGWLLNEFARFSIAVAIINLIIPVYPFSANRLIQLFVSPETVARLNHYEKPLQILLILFTAFGFLSMIVNPIQMAIIRMVM